MLKNPENKGQYLYCHEARAARYILGKTPYRGICTGDVNICAIFCYRSKDNRRFSLVHVNRHTTASLLLQEAQWVGKDGQCTVYSRYKKSRKVENGNEYIIGVEFLEDPNIRDSCQYEVVRVKPEVNSFLLNSNAKVTLLEDNLKSITAVHHPYSIQLTVCAKLNVSFIGKDYASLKQQQLIYNGEQWQQLQSHDLVLHPLVRKIITRLKVTENDSMLTIRQAVNRYQNSQFELLSEEMQRTIQESYHEAELLSIQLSHFIQLYLLKNDRERYFSSNLAFELHDPEAPKPSSSEDKQLFNDLKALLRGKQNVVERVCELLKQRDRKTLFRDNIIGLVLGTGGYHEYYTLSLTGTWLDLSSVEAHIDSTRDLEHALRSVAASSNLQSLTILARAVNNVNPVGQSIKSALHHAVINNKADMVEYLLTLGADRTCLDDKQKMPIDYADGDCKIRLEKHMMQGKNEFM